MYFKDHLGDKGLTILSETVGKPLFGKTTEQQGGSPLEGTKNYPW